MRIEKKIKDLKQLIETYLNNKSEEGFEALYPLLEEINADFETLSDKEKANYIEPLNEINTLLNELLTKELKIQASLKEEIDTINMRSNALNAYQNTSKLGS